VVTDAGRYARLFPQPCSSGGQEFEIREEHWQISDTIYFRVVQWPGGSELGPAIVLTRCRHLGIELYPLIDPVIVIMKTDDFGWRLVLAAGFWCSIMVGPAFWEINRHYGLTSTSIAVISCDALC
jgi:hypothetical protein